MKNILLYLAALAATSCSLQLDSQYGLRWDPKVTAPRDHIAHLEPHYGEVAPIQTEPTPQNQSESTESRTLAVPVAESYIHNTVAEVNWDAPQLALNDRAPMHLIEPHLNDFADSVPSEEAVETTSRFNVGKLVGLGFLMFVFFVALIISALTALIAFLWWIPVNDDPLISGILPLFIAIGSVVGIVKVGRKIDQLKQDMKSKKKG